MAEAAQVLLLVALLSNIHAEVLQREGTSHRFVFDKPADYCSISRWTAEVRQLLFNSTQLHNSSLVRDAAYELSGLKVSDSGQYQEQCWTRGKLTHERNSTLLICGKQKMTLHTSTPFVGQTLELTCDGVGPNRSVQWALEYRSHKKGGWALAPIDDDDVSAMYTLHRVKNKSSLLITAVRSHGLMSYYCLEKSQQRCDALSGFLVDVPAQNILRSVGESLELNCSGASGNQTHEWRMVNSVMDGERVSDNYTLMFPSLALNHAGEYTCVHSDRSHDVYDLSVCPESEPPAVLLFTGGGILSLQCGTWKQTGEVRWFMRSNRTEGRVLKIYKHLPPETIYVSNTSLVITNVSVEDSGQFWCLVEKDRLCVFRSETMVMFGEPEVDHHLVRSVLVSVAMVAMCVVVLTVVCSTRRREQLPAPVEELEMSHLSPASDEETPV